MLVENLLSNNTLHEYFQFYAGTGLLGLIDIFSIDAE